MAAALCDHCAEPIGYGVRYYRVDAGMQPGAAELAHALCEELAAEGCAL